MKQHESDGKEEENNELEFRRAYFDSFTRMRFMWIEFNGYTEHIQTKNAHFMSQCANRNKKLSEQKFQIVIVSL